MRRLVWGLPTFLVLLAGACSRSPQHYLDLGNRLAAQNKYTDAALNYRKAIQKNASFGEAYYQLGLTELKLGKPQDALALLLGAVKLMPARDDVKVKLADLCLSLFIADRRHPQVLFDRTAIVSDQLLLTNPHSFDGLRLKAQLSAISNRFEEAEQLYSQANQVKPMQPEVILGWTEALLQRKQMKQVETLARQLIGANKTYLPIYNVLYRCYVSAGQLGDAEEVLQTKIANNPNDVTSRLELAAFYGESSREAEMRAVLARMVDDPKGFPLARLQVGDLYSRMQRWNDALAYYEAGAKATADKKDRILYTKRIADIWLAQGRGEQASAVVDEILKEQPGDTSAQAVKASLLLSTHQPENVAKAVVMLQNIAKKKPDDSTLRYNLGRALIAKGDTVAARTEFLEAAKRSPGFLGPRLALLELAQAQHDYKITLQYANEILAINPNLPAVRLVRAVSLLNTGNVAQGRKELTAIEKAFPRQREVLLQLAALDLRDKKFKEAEEHFRKLAQGTSGDIRPMTGVVKTLAAENQLDEAVSFLQQELKKSPRNSQVRFLLASAAVQMGRYDLAIDQYQQLLRAAPNSAVVYLGMGAAYHLKGDAAASISCLQKAEGLAPKNPATHMALADVLQMSGHKMEALDHYRRAIQLKPDNAVALNNAAYLLTETGGSLDEALKMAQKAVQLDAQQPGFSDTLGWIYLKENHFDSALQIFRHLTQRYPENASFHYHLGVALLQKGEKAAARAELTMSLSKQPSDKDRQDIEAALARIR